MSAPFSVKNIRTGDELALDLDVGALSVMDNGSQQAASVDMTLVDPGSNFVLLAEDELQITSVENPATEVLFGGFARSVIPTITANGRQFAVKADDYSTLLDRINVIDDTRPAESMVTRLVYLMTTYASGLLDASSTYMAALGGTLPSTRLRVISLRQAIETTLGQALVTANYRLRSDKKLEVWDDRYALLSAPFDIVVGTPGVGQVAPEDLQIEGNSSELYNAYYVRGATLAGSGWFTDLDSIDRYGRRERFIDAPDAEFFWQAYNIGHAALADNAWPKRHGSFSATSPVDGWRSQQRTHVTSPHHFESDGNPLVAAPFDIVSVTTKFLSGVGDRSYVVAFGDPPILFTPLTGAGGGSGSAGSVGTEGEAATCEVATVDDFERTAGPLSWGTASGGLAWGAYDERPSPAGSSVIDVRSGVGHIDPTNIGGGAQADALPLPFNPNPDKFVVRGVIHLVPNFLTLSNSAVDQVNLLDYRINVGDGTWDWGNQQANGTFHALLTLELNRAHTPGHPDPGGAVLTVRAWDESASGGLGGYVDIFTASGIITLAPVTFTIDRNTTRGTCRITLDTGPGGVLDNFSYEFATNSQAPSGALQLWAQAYLVTQNTGTVTSQTTLDNLRGCDA